MTTLTPEGYELSDDPQRLDFDVIAGWLTEDAYWGRWRAHDDIRRQVEGSFRVVGAYAPDGRQVAFARALSDGVALAYLADVSS